MTLQCCLQGSAECSPGQCTHCTRAWGALQDQLGGMSREEPSHCLSSPPKASSEAALHEQSWFGLQHTPRTGQMLSPRSHVESPADQSQVTTCHLYSQTNPIPLVPCVSHSDFFLGSFSKGPIAISLSHPLGERQRTESEQQPLTPSPKTSLVFVALYLLLFSKSREKQTM